ncbi:hypothetical protein SSP531S_27090 [Streptomyces spongiicola]|uniref:XRE family transcriptional regulator n=1 Tax=Streptomyces spongiicola TaxID=1690221 RepID=A0A388SY69_9ACTN|nr:hypothetical protein [Streptomyces spongiicola]GBQ01276.1 hypothetical protein SSP531S_27090 [Streptomyces spongiicola]
MGHAVHSAHTRAELDRVLLTGPFHLALRAALAVRGLPLQRVQHHLAHRGIKVGVTSLSYWQQGARRPRRPESLRAVRALEDVLGLPENSLLRLLPGDGGPGPQRPAAPSPRTPAAASAAVERLLTGLGRPADGGLHTMGHHERVRIGPGGELLGRDSQKIVRARRDGVDRLLAVHRGDAGWDPARVTVRATENCRPGRVRYDRDAGVLVAELLLDARLRSGETYLLCYGFEDGTAGPSGEYLRGFRDSGGQYVLQIRFDTAALPVRCRHFAQNSPGAARICRAELAPSGRHPSVHLVDQEVRPGIQGIDWQWER